MTCTWNKRVTPTTQIKSPIQTILECLELDAGDEALLNAKKDAYRITFEHNFAIELLELSDNACRVSARVCLLGKSLSGQENQITKALQLYQEVQSEAPRGTSLAVSDHDSCLRLVNEVGLSDQTGYYKAQFENFLNFSFVFKKTFLEQP